MTRWRNDARHWGLVASLLHWLIALLVMVQFVLGWMAELWRLSPTKLDLFIWHKSLGITTLALVLVRLGWRWANPVPSLPGDIPTWERRAARVNQYLLYGLLLLMPLSGWVINSAANIPFRLFWVWELPDIVPRDDALAATFKTIHLWGFWVMAGLILVHLAAALDHHFRRRNRVLTNMLPNRGKS